jgi:hypothetical protein
MQISLAMRHIHKLLMSLVNLFQFVATTVHSFDLLILLIVKDRVIDIKFGNASFLMEDL